MKTIAIMNQKGGVGKTTTSIELAYYFAGGPRGTKENRTLVIDLDSQCNMSKYVEADLDLPTIYNVFKGELHPLDAVQKTNWFDIIPGSPSLTEFVQNFEKEDLELLKVVFEIIEDEYDFVIIDSAPARSALSYLIYAAVDYIIPVAECDDGSMDGIMELSADLDRFFANNKTHAKILGLLMTKYERTNMHALGLETLNEIAERIGTVVFKTKINKSIVATEAKTARMPITAYASIMRPIVRDYRSLFIEINKMIAQ